MPATRSRQPLQSHTNAGRAPDADIIILSSDDDMVAHKENPVSKRSFRQSVRQRGKIAVPLSAEVVEISSDEETTATSRASKPQSSIMILRQQLKAAQEEVERLKTEVSASTSRVQELEKESANGLPFSLEDSTNCEICTFRMWTPYTLPCGHTFCQTCLQGWFSTTLTQHMTNFPHFNLDSPGLLPLRTTLRNPQLSQQQRRHILAEMAVIRAQQPQPQYTCPACRTEVQSRPVEVYALKSVVRSISGALGESSPKKVVPARRRGAAAARPVDNPWDGFFP